jgi:hypothetical protein
LIKGIILVAGIIVGAGGLLYLQERNKSADDNTIIFASKFFYDNKDVVMVSGTMTGEGQAYPNNSYSIGCFKDRSECWLTSIQQIGNRQVSRMDTPYQYEIQKWTEHEIVAGDDGTFGCYRITITIDRQSKEALWVEEAVNQTQLSCKNSENKVRKYTIESSPGWKRVFGSKS